MTFEQRLATEIPHLRRYARGLCGDPSAADDLVQDCLERAMRKGHLWQPIGRLRSWLFKLLYRLYLNSRQTATARRESTHPDPARDQQVWPTGEMDVRCRQMLALVDRLPSPQRDALLLMALEQPSYRDAARILGICVGTLRSRLARGREALRDMQEQREAPRALRRVK
ncbi:MAG: RNA polymerase sigma factor [Salinisphaeraceae bacterium]